MGQSGERKVEELKMHTMSPKFSRSSDLSPLADLLQVQRCQTFDAKSGAPRRKGTSSRSSPLSNKNSVHPRDNINSPSVPKSPCNLIFSFDDTHQETCQSKDRKEVVNNNTKYSNCAESDSDDLTNCSKVIKSGGLVYIIPQQCAKSPNHPSTNENGLNTPTRSAKRCPVTVKIHKKAFEKYAIITQGRKVHTTTPPVFLQLRNVVVTQNENTPATFTVVVNGVEGRYFQFEASSPEKAQEWIEAFSTPAPAPRSPRRQVGNFQWRSDNESDNCERPQGDGLRENNLCVPQYPPFYERTFPSPTHSPRATRNSMMPVLTESFEESDDESEALY